MSETIKPGLITLHGNQLEDIRSAVFQWIADKPLEPLEDEIFLVQSNGVAEWLKIALAEATGICAGTRVTLPARFLWQAYRDMLGPRVVVPRSAFEKAPLACRLMNMLPGLFDQKGFEPLRQFMSRDEPERLMQLADRIADLFDQYQVYRADWLADWAAGLKTLRPAAGAAVPLPADQVWQALLWQAVVESMADGACQGRAQIHARFVEAFARGEAPVRPLPRRVILIGISALPYQTLEALAALSKSVQVIIAVSNPCQYYWGDIISGRELLTARRGRQPLREGRDLSTVAHESLHLHCNPLLAGWGRLGRDFIRMLDEFDTSAAEKEFAGLRVDLFSQDAGATLLAQVQAGIRDMAPVNERLPVQADDRSVQFHLAHSIQREVEVLHDCLLSKLAEGGDAPLRPRDVVVLVPDIDAFTPAIHAVFGQQAERDPRRIPYAIADVRQRQADPLLLALEWLLRLPDQRCLQSEIRDLLDVPALAARFGIALGDMACLAHWIDDAGVRWGLDQGHRASLGLGDAGEQNAWLFGIRRMLLGYACGAGAAFGAIEPYADVSGLDAALAGSLASLVTQLIRWQGILGGQATPATWGERARALLRDFFKAEDPHDRATLARLDQGLGVWLDDCGLGGLESPVSLVVLREAWLEGLDAPSVQQRFVAGGVTFCTLMPMRAVPFRMVCLLGMNDGDYPRRAPRADFDLLAQPAMARPGDRSRRDDDRYMMLEALLSARETLHVSWVGRNVHDNSAQPPSVLVAQLREHIAAGWQVDLETLTTCYPLQPFSRRYFEPGVLRTHAAEWWAAHAPAAPVSAALPALLPVECSGTLSSMDLAAFVRQPVNDYFRRQLQVVFPRKDNARSDDEPFSFDGLESYKMADELLRDDGPHEPVEQASIVLAARAARLGRQGKLPIGEIGLVLQGELVAELTPVRQTWLRLCARYPASDTKLHVSLAMDDGMAISEWIDRLHGDREEAVWLAMDAGNIATTVKKDFAPRASKLIAHWLRHLCIAAHGYHVTGYVVGRNAVVMLQAVAQDEARAMLETVVACWKEGQRTLPPTACDTAIAWVEDNKPGDAYDGADFPGAMPGEAARNPCLARNWPDYAALSGADGWEAWTQRLYGPLVAWRNASTQAFTLEDFDALKAST